jgi:hypothetical protein
MALITSAKTLNKELVLYIPLSISIMSRLSSLWKMEMIMRTEDRIKNAIPILSKKGKSLVIIRVWLK